MCSDLRTRFRKNLKRLYVVHPSPWFHLLMQVFGPVISLASWALSVTGLSTPSATSSQSLIGLNSTAHFGVHLETLMGQQGARGLPRVVADCIRFILANGLETEGLFRVSPSLPSVMILKELYNSGAVQIQIEDYGGVHSACGLLKLFFRELPTPVFEPSLYDTIRKIQSFNDKTEPTQLTFLKTILLPILPTPSYIILRALFQLLNQIHANELTTRMHSGNLAIVWAPNLCRSANPVVDLGMCAVGANGGGIGTLVKICVERWEDVFGDQAGAGEELQVEEPGPVRIQSNGDLLELGDIHEVERVGRKSSRSSDQLLRGRPASMDGAIVAAMESGAPMPRSRSRISSGSSGRNRHTVVVAENSTLAIAGEALSHRALADASSKGAGIQVFGGRN
ncbi:Rho GTPase activation protein [Chytriomyces sp. MP71]|nr:Rho GTPase activation protein [Chytriomyces sp. MP71]